MAEQQIYCIFNTL